MKRIIDWYWNEGCLRNGEHALSRGSWLDSLYAIASRRDAMSASDVSGGAKRVLGIWGPSQSGKSTLLSRYLDAGRTAEGSPCLTWDPSAPTIFLHRPHRTDHAVVLNPDNKGIDASACVTRYTLVSEVKYPKYPVQLRFNSVAHIMHALARGYLSECRLDAADGKVVIWDDRTIEEAFLSVPSAKGVVVDQEAFELLRETLCIVDLFVATKEPRYGNLSKDWKLIRQRLLNDSPALRSVDEVVRLAKRLLWDDAASVSATFDRLREKSLRLSWPEGRVYCSMQVAGLILDFETFRRFKESDPNESDRQVADAVGLLGFRRQGGDILVECGNESPEIARDNFGLFQALVRELVVPVRKPTLQSEADSAFFRLLSVADLLDFPGVALADSANSDAALINPLTTPASDRCWLRNVYKRGKTASIVHGYAQDVSIDAFALLVRSGEFPAKPRQLTSGITHWWKGVTPAFDPSDVTPGSQPPLPLSICLTFFAIVVNKQQTGSSTGLHGTFGDMLGRMTPLTLGNNSQLFATTYKHFDKTGGKIQGTPEEISKAAEFIFKDAAFRSAFHNDVARDSFKAMIDREDGGVEFFLGQQVEAVGKSARKAKLAAIAQTDQARFAELLEEALPSGDDDGAAQSRVIRKFVEHVGRFRSGEAETDGLKYLFPEHETPDSHLSYWLRLLTFAEESIVDPVPTNFSQRKMDIRRKYVADQWQHWRESVQFRLRNQPDFSWSRFGLEGEAEGQSLLKFLSEHDAAGRLFDWISEEMGDIQHESVARSMRRELAVAMGNILRHGMHHLSVSDARQPLDILRDQSRRRAGDGSVPSPHELAVIDGFLARLKSFRPALAKRPPQPGDEALRELRAKL